MSDQLELSADLALPLDAVTQTFAFMARRGAGKTYAATKLCEQMLDHQAQVVVLDPVGVWWGLRLLADGRTPSGYQIPVFGGLHADLPLTPESGARIADLIIDRQLSAILDVSMLRKGQRARFAADFGEQLFARKKSHRSALHLFIEEAQVIIPQQIAADETRMAGAFEDLVRLGRNFGIGASLISQRPQSVNKEVLNQTECLVALQLSGSHERKAVENWIVYQGQSRAIVDELPSLERGTAWVWSPQWLRVMQKVRIARKRTYDASATPEVGTALHVPAQLAPLDLAELRELLAETEEPAQDVAGLKRTVADLRKQLAERPTPTVERVEVPVLPEGVREAYGEAWEAFQQLDLALLTAMGKLTSLASRIAGAPPAINEVAPPQRPNPAPPRSSQKSVAAPPVPAPTKPASKITANGSISGPQQRILDAIAAFEALGIRHPARSNVAVWADQSSTSSSYGNNLGRLRTLGFVDYPSGGLVALTDQGRAQARAVTIRTPEELREVWYARLSGPQARILRLLVDAYPESRRRDWVATASGQSHTSSSYGNNLGRLRGLGLVDYPDRGTVVATELLFPEVS